MDKQVNYNSISNSYDKRYTASPLQGLAQEFLDLIQREHPVNILEIGCGTGHWLNLISSPNTNLYGIDLSLGMLREANKNNNKLKLVNAKANQLPLIKSHFDLIMCINAIHHFENPLGFVSSIKSLLKPGGRFYIAGLDPADLNIKWYLYDYFNNAYEYDLKRYPKFEELNQALSENGFAGITIKTLHIISNIFINDKVFTDTFIEKDQASQLAILSDEEYQIGIAKIKTAINTANMNKTELIFPVHLIFKGITGTVLV